MLRPTLIAAALLAASCAQFEPRHPDPVTHSLVKHLDRPVLAMARRFGPASEQKIEQGVRRWYMWNFRESSGECTVSARVDGQEVVIDAYWNGNRDVCARVLEATAPLADG